LGRFFIIYGIVNGSNNIKMVMDRIYYDKKKRKWLDVPGDWKEFEEKTGNLTINLHQRLRKKVDNIKKIITKKWDAVIVIDGGERSGKSTLGMTLAWYFSNTKLTIDNFAAGMQDAAEKIEKLPDGSILFVDEGSLVFNSKDSMTREAKKLQKILDIVGQKNMFFIVVLPSFFDLNKNVAVRRSKFLLHVYTGSDMTRGRFCYFSTNKKRKLYELGKKNFGSYNKPKSDWLGNFDKFELPFNDEYLRLKRKSLDEALSGDSRDDGKISLADIRAYITRDLLTNLPITKVSQLAKLMRTSTKTLYVDQKRELPEILTNIKQGQKRLNVDLNEPTKC